MDLDPDYLARLVHEHLFGHLEHRVCDAQASMPMAEKDAFRWSHPDAIQIGQGPFANHVDLYHCPHCGLSFTSFPRPQ